MHNTTGSPDPSGVLTMRFPALLLACTLLLQCAVPAGAYKGYRGEERPVDQLALVRGEVYSRLDWINRFDDAVRFFSVDGRAIENSERFRTIRVTPGSHDIRVYFSWDMGNRRGLAPALVTYAANRESMSRTLTLTVEAGEEYLVRAEPVFDSEIQDITTLSYVDFWVVDSDDNIVVSREEGRYRPEG
ncbi:MAG: hypothetical protein WDZ76_00535 [Pseudohongiellaceae bacterium]